jgi:transcriptional regulator GlxA family with amidase domain
MPQPAATHKPDPVHRGTRTPLRVGVILADHFTLSAFAVFIDHLRLAADEGDRSRPMHVQWWVMARQREAVLASCGVMIVPTSEFLAPAALDYLVVIGGVLHAGPQIDEATARYLREVAAAGVPLIGVCTGSFILCRAGLMKGRRTCVSWYHYQDFLQAFPDHEVVADRLFLADGPRITCAGGAGAAALATHLIELHLGRAVAQKASQVLLFDRRGSGLALPSATHALCALADRQHRPFGHRDCHRSRICRLRPFLAPVQGRIWPVALHASPAAGALAAGRSRRRARVRLSAPRPSAPA